MQWITYTDRMGKRHRVPFRPICGGAPLTISDFNPILKEFYLPLFEEQYNRQMVLMDEVILKRDSEHIEGKNAYIAVEWETWAGTGSRAEEGTLPTPEPGDYQRVQIPMKYHYAAFRITGQVIEASASDPGAFAPAIQREMRTKITSFLKHHNRQFWGDGSGVLAYVDGAPSGTTFTCDAAYGIANDINGAQFLSKNQHLDFYTAKTGGTYRGSAKITAAPTKGSGASTSATFVVDADPGAQDNDLVFLEGSRGNEMMGMLGHIDTTDFVTTHQGLSRSTYPDWRAQKRQGATAGTNEALTLLRMQLLWNDVAFTGGGNTKLIIGSPGAQLTYAMMAKREGMTVNKMDLDNGWSGLDFNGQAAVMADQYAPANRFFYIDPTYFRLYEMARPQWLDRGTGVLKQVGRTDVFEAVYFHYAELGSSKNMAQGVLEDITELS